MAKNLDASMVSQVQQSLKAYRENNYNQTHAAESLGIPRTTLANHLMMAERHDITLDSDVELIIKNVELAKQKQKQQDVNRIERKAFREHARVENSVAEFYKEYVELLKQYKPFNHKPIVTNVDQSEHAMMVHWSDLHLNERVELPHNTYDWKIAAKRIRKHVLEAIRIGKAYNVTKLLIGMTGDNVNSDRRTDEMLANAGNRAKATILATDLLKQAITELSEHFDVSVTGISGNESRINKDLGWTDEGASDNFDFIIYETLNLLLKDSNIRFIRSQNPSEIVLNFHGLHLLLIHGHGSLGTGNLQKSVQEIKGRYLASGVQVDYVFWGHIHEAVIADWYARSSSLVGSNTWNEKALNLAGRASQNVYIFSKDGSFHGVKIDLQNTDGINGYSIDERLEAYNTKSAKKLHNTETVFRVVV